MGGGEYPVWTYDMFQASPGYSYIRVPYTGASAAPGQGLRITTTAVYRVNHQPQTTSMGKREADSTVETMRDDTATLELEGTIHEFEAM